MKKKLKTYEDVRVEGSIFELSLEKILGKKIKDIRGYLSREFDDISFKMTSVILEDDTELGCEGEHDYPYLIDFSEKTEKDFESIEKTNPDYEPDEDDD